MSNVLLSLGPIRLIRQGMRKSGGPVFTVHCHVQTARAACGDDGAVATDIGGRLNPPLLLPSTNSTRGLGGWFHDADDLLGIGKDFGQPPFLRLVHKVLVAYWLWNLCMVRALNPYKQLKGGHHVHCTCDRDFRNLAKKL